MIVFFRATHAPTGKKKKKNLAEGILHLQNYTQKCQETQLKMSFCLISYPGVNVLVSLHKKVNNSIYSIYFLTFLLFIFQIDAP